MINVDLSKFVPKGAHEQLATFIPGLFFQVSILLASPDLVSRLAAETERSLNLGRYTTLAIALFLAFVIGGGFVPVDSMIRIASSP